MPPRAPSADMSWKEAIQRVLSESNGALHYTEITDRILSNNLVNSMGATPVNTVAAMLSISLREEGEKSPYLKVGRGEYTLKAAAAEISAQVSNDTSIAQEEAGALRAFGMYWVRDSVWWLGKPQLLGRQGAGATNVNFADQIGVYLLHDRERVIYVGRADDTLFARLKAHTVDRLGARWDRFSWFGLRSVDNKGELSNTTEIPWSQDVVVETMEALLIESLEPPLNRRRGDNFSAAEYIQTPDPQIEKAKKAAIIRELTEGVLK